MLIQSKRFRDKVIEVSFEQWQKMKDQDMARRWKVISSSDLAPEGTPPPPQDVISFMTEKPEVKKIYEDYETMKKDELIEYAKDKIDIPEKATKKEIIEQLNNLQDE